MLVLCIADSPSPSRREEHGPSRGVCSVVEGWPLLPETGRGLDREEGMKELCSPKGRGLLSMVDDAEGVPPKGKMRRSG